jgi:5-methylcytosine-specific restriction protein B
MSDQQTVQRFDLSRDEDLRAACEAVEPYHRWRGDQAEWVPKVARTIREVRAADHAKRANHHFQVWLWEGNDIAAIGQGNISVEGALREEEFREWLAARSLQPLPAVAADIPPFLDSFYDQIVERLTRLLTTGKWSRIPHLKIYRVLAALYPEAMTTVANRQIVSQIAAEMGSGPKLSPIECHRFIRRRLDSVLGPASDEPEALALRMVLPWKLYERFIAPRSGPSLPLNTVRAEEGHGLSPLPAVRRRRGLTPIKGLFQSILSCLEFVRAGVTRQELLDFLRAASPDAKAAALGLTINVLESEFGVVQHEGSRYTVTESGRLALETQDSIHLADWVLTRVLGVDLAIAALRDRQSLSASELTTIVRTANPSWQTDFIPQSIVSWLRSLKVTTQNDESRLVLSETGRRWASLITWKPETLPHDVESVTTVSLPEPPAPDVVVRLPSLDDIVAAVGRRGHFPVEQIVSLHASLWAHERRHFAILTGLSGSGKTLLARGYAEAITPAATERRRCTIPVQPGWYDASALLGFQNPLRGSSYVRTEFLDFLIAAADDPGHPYVAVLDEMNLSHPEQYMAPLLSAMETGDQIVLHNDASLASSVPGAIRYPRNLVLIGTMNTDETTHGLSDKVLDRAFVHEFWDVDLDAYPRWGTRDTLDASQEATARDVLTALMAALAPARRHFGWRVVDDTLDFLARAVHGSRGLTLTIALDTVVHAKVLPKLRGDDSPRFRDALSGCEGVLARFDLKESRGKLQQLQRDLDATGSAQFWR